MEFVCVYGEKASVDKGQLDYKHVPTRLRSVIICPPNLALPAILDQPQPLEGHCFHIPSIISQHILECSPALVKASLRAHQSSQYRGSWHLHMMQIEIYVTNFDPASVVLGILEKKKKKNPSPSLS